MELENADLCPTCGEIIKRSETLGRMPGGKKIRCPLCGESLWIPGDENEPITEYKTPLEAAV